MAELPALGDARNFWMMRVSIRSLAALFLVCAAGSVRADISAGSPGLLPPQVDPAAARVRRGEQVRITLRGHYGGTGLLHFAIVRPPAHGNLSAFRELGDNRASVFYTPDGTGKKDVDGFSYLAQAGSRVSSVAEVRIEIEELPARLDVPAQLEFGQVAAGKSSSRQLTIRNAGGGILSGRLTISSPWKISATDYRVAAGTAQKVTVFFQPNESKDFVGQVTLTGETGEAATISLGGNGFAPAGVAEAPAASATPTPVGSPAVAAEEPTSIAVATPIPNPPASFSVTPAPSPNGLPPHPTEVARAHNLLPAPTPFAEGTPQVLLNTAVKITTRRLSPTNWEVRWPAERMPGTMYRLEERLLSLEGEELKVAWHELAGPKLNIATNPIVAPVTRLNARHAHFLRLTALNREGALLWESPLVVLEAQPSPSRRQFFLLLCLGSGLVAVLFLRWRERHVPA
ncbi:MAG: hypothetical protein H0X40_10270 [Chthoniobacterales bacterium]|nr:hypothetical protein [Chthoniobacterales bacterium]